MKVELWQKFNHRGIKIAIKRADQEIPDNRDVWRIPVREELTIGSLQDLKNPPVLNEVIYKRIGKTPMFESDNESKQLIGY